jgi:hypothetical protein
MVYNNIKTIGRVMTLIISLVIVGVSLIAFNNVINEVQLSESDYNLEESQLAIASDEIKRNVDYYIENEKALFERNIRNELFYLLSYMEIEYGQDIGNLNSFLHYKEVEDILFMDGDNFTDHNPEAQLFEEMDDDEKNYMLLTLRNNISIRSDGSFYYYWPSKEDDIELDRKVVYFKSSENGYTMAISFKTQEYSEIIRWEVRNWLESVYTDEVLIYDIESKEILNDGIIENFNIKRVIDTSEFYDQKFIYEQDGTQTRIIYLSEVEDMSIVFANELVIKDYSNVIIMTLGNKKVVTTIAIGVILIIIIKLLEYAWIKRVVDLQYFDKRFIYETLEFCSDGVAVLDQRFVIEDCNEKFKAILGLDVFIKDNYNLKKMIPSFKFIKEPYDLIFMNKKSEFINGSIIVKKIESKYIVKITRTKDDQLIQYMDFREFRETVIRRTQEQDVYVENNLFAMISIENGIQLDHLMNKLRTYFNSQGLITLVTSISQSERVCYIEGIDKLIFDNSLENLIDNGGFSRSNNINYSSLLIKKNDFPINMDFIMEELDFKLYEIKKKND